MKLLFSSLCIDDRAAEILLPFYEQNIGMTVLYHYRSDSVTAFWLGFSELTSSSTIVKLSAFTEFRILKKLSDEAKTYASCPDKDSYWKIGLVMQDVGLGRAQLMKNNVEVTQPRQFSDIGFLCHFADPVGFKIELLQHDFSANARPISDPELNYPLGQPVGIGQISLRVKDIKVALAFYCELLGMKLLSRQDVMGKFVLYFTAFTSEEPPFKDVNAVENREWLWKRPYTTLELMHDGSCTDYMCADVDRELGFLGIGILVEAEEEWTKLWDKCQSNPTVTVKSVPGFDDLYLMDSFSIMDPDGSLVTLLKDRNH